MLLQVFPLGSRHRSQFACLGGRTRAASAAGPCKAAGGAPGSSSAAPPATAAAASEAGMGILPVAVVTPLASSVPASAAAPGPLPPLPPPHRLHCPFASLPLLPMLRLPHAFGASSSSISWSWYPSCLVLAAALAPRSLRRDPVLCQFCCSAAASEAPTASFVSASGSRRICATRQQEHIGARECRGG